MKNIQLLFLLLISLQTSLHAQLILANPDVVDTNEKANPIVSQKIPQLIEGNDDIMSELQNTVWSTRDVPQDRDLYVFFVNNKYGNVGVQRGEKAVFPQEFFPMRFVQKGSLPFSGIYIIPSKEKLLYYSFHMINPYYLVISGGYTSIEPLLKITLEDYLKDGYMMQLIY